MEYIVTVWQESRRNITVEAFNESAARAVAVLETRRLSGPSWNPAPPQIKANERTAFNLAVLTVEPRLPTNQEASGDP